MGTWPKDEDKHWDTIQSMQANTIRCCWYISRRGHLPAAHPPQETAEQEEPANSTCASVAWRGKKIKVQVTLPTVMQRQTKMCQVMPCQMGERVYKRLCEWNRALELAHMRNKLKAAFCMSWNVLKSTSATSKSQTPVNRPKLQLIA